MKKNEGTIDRIIRVLLSIVLFSLFFFLKGNLRYLALLGFIPLITAIIGFCPLYKLFHINTNKPKK